MADQSNSAAVLWFTGLSGAGKSTLAAKVEQEIRERGFRTEYLDGDALRALAPTGFTRADRDTHVKRVGFIASCLERHDVTVVCALISPYADTRNYVRQLCRRFIEIYVATPLEECERRDVKGLYARARRGEVAHFTGIDDPYEPPRRPELVLDTTRMTVPQAVIRVLEAWETSREWRCPSPRPSSRANVQRSAADACAGDHSDTCAVE
jgi:adenylylsulfate kinase